MPSVRALRGLIGAHRASGERNFDDSRNAEARGDDGVLVSTQHRPGLHPGGQAHCGRDTREVVPAQRGLLTRWCHSERQDLDVAVLFVVL